MDDTYSQIGYVKLYIYGNQRDTGETEVADIVIADEDGCNGAYPLPIGESGGRACRIPSF